MNSLMSFLQSKTKAMNHNVPSIQQWLSFTNLSLLCPLILATIFMLKFTRKSNSKTLPPSPPRLPFIGNLHQLDTLLHRSLASMSKKYGDIMLLYFCHVPTLIISSVESAEEVMKTQDLVFASRPTMSLANKLVYNAQDIGLAKYGEPWRQARKICAIHLFSLKRVQSFRNVRTEEVGLFVEAIRENSSSGRVKIGEMISKLTCDVTCRAALGRKYFGGGKIVQDLIWDFSSVLSSFPMRDYLPFLGFLDWLGGLDSRTSRIGAKLDDFLEKVLEEHTSKKKTGIEDDNHDLVDVLLSLNGDSCDAKESNNFELSRDAIKAIVWDIFTGGTETTYSTMEWAMAELIRHPEEMKRVQEEVRRTVRKTREVVNEDSLEEMQYLKLVIKETLRLHPPLPLLLPHESTENASVLGYHIPAQTRVMVNVWAIGRDPRYWERAGEFWPCRFVESDIDFRGQDFQFLPFGAGRRICPGMNFGLPLVELTLANLLCHFDWELPSGVKAEEMDMTEVLSLSLRKKSSLVLVAKPWTC